MSAEPFDLDAELRRLEEKIDLLATVCRDLRAENQALKVMQEEWLRERSQLADKTALAKGRVESMITRLKSMGYET